jgi:hypothetical protein
MQHRLLRSRESLQSDRPFQYCVLCALLKRPVNDSALISIGCGDYGVDSATASRTVAETQRPGSTRAESKKVTRQRSRFVAPGAKIKLRG